MHSVLPYLPHCFYCIIFFVLSWWLCDSASIVQYFPFLRTQAPPPQHSLPDYFVPSPMLCLYGSSFAVLHGNSIFVTLSSPLCLKHFSSMTQAHCIYLYCSLDLSFWLCLNRCTEDSPPCPRFCRRYFVTAAQCPCIPVSMTISSKHRRRDICAPDPHLRPRGSGCTDSPLIPDLGLSRSHSAFPTPQF